MADAGKVLLMSKGTYSASTNYEVLDWVRYSNATYVSKHNNNQGNTPTGNPTDTHWALLCQDGSGGGSTVAWTQLQSTGTQIATIEIDGVQTAVYAPTGGGGSYSAGNGITITGSTIAADFGSTANKVAEGNHTHTISLAGDSGTADITLAANTKYKLTAGGNSVVFQTPPDTQPGTGVLTIQQNGTNVDTFSANATSNKSINIVTPKIAAIATSATGSAVTFLNVDLSKHYSIDADLGNSWDAPVPSYTNVQIVETTTGIGNITYTLSGANANQTFHLIDEGIN